jgi:hypothetical protein
VIVKMPGPGATRITVPNSSKTFPGKRTTTRLASFRSLSFFKAFLHKSPNELRDREAGDFGISKASTAFAWPGSTTQSPGLHETSDQLQ